MKENERKCKKMKENGVPCQNVHYSLWNYGSRPGGSAFSLGEEQTFFRMQYSLGKRGATREGTARGPARTSFVEKRDKYF